jgi:hypothetical protein
MSSRPPLSISLDSLDSRFSFIEALRSEKYTLLEGIKRLLCKFLVTTQVVWLKAED